MNRQEKGRLYIIMTKLQALSGDLKMKLKDASEGAEGNLMEKVGDLGEKLEGICRDLYELGGKLETPQEPTARYDLNRIVPRTIHADFEHTLPLPPGELL